MTHQPTRPKQSEFSSPQRGDKRFVFIALGALCVLIYTGAKLFDIEDSLLFSALAAAMFGFAAFSIRLVLGRLRRGTQAGSSPNTPTMGPARQLNDAPAAGETEEKFVHHGGKHWSLDVFAAIDAQRFAAVCETWFSWAGFDTRTQAHRTDGGVDIWLHAARMPGPVAIVRCKHWINKPVGLEEMKEFQRVVSSFHCAHGTYTTTSTYTQEALQFAREHGIDAVDGRGLLRRIQTRTRQRQQALLAVAYSGQG